ncbi:MAG TPA: TolC family protein [Fimbriiglobus sp.]|jgi:hypothetical protein
MRPVSLPQFAALPSLPGRIGLTAITFAFVGLAGCSRLQYRERADRDVEGVITQKNIFPEWGVENWHAYPDSRARYADAGSPDFPAYPPDDYAAWVLSPNPQKPGRGGAGRYEGTGYLEMIQAWDAGNRAGEPAPPPTDTANPAPLESYVAAVKEDRTPYRITLEQACELALLNGREFQDRREDLYLAALSVTQERFTFAAQAFAAEQVIRESTGSETVEGAGNRWRLNTTAGIGKTFASGGQLLVSFANQIVVELGGDKPQVGISNLSLTLLQPFLRGGGYAVTLEALTQAERTLLYAIRSFARFRKVFYVAIAGTGDYTNNPYGLQGLSANLGRAVGNNFTAPRAGYLPTLLRAATLANEQENVVALGQTLKLFNNLKEGGIATELQAVRVEQQLIRGRTTVLIDTRLYQEAVDNFKLQLGVPLTIPLELDDTPVRPVRKQLARFDKLYADLRAVQNAAGKFDANEPVQQYRERWRKLLTETPLSRGTNFAQKYPGVVAELAKLTTAQLEKRVSELGAARQKLLDAKTDRQLANKPDTPADEAALDANEAATDFARFELALRQYEAKPWIRLPADRQAGEQAAVFRAAFESGMIVAVTVRNERMDKIRADWPLLPGVVFDDTDVLQVPLDEAFTKVEQVALTNRLDLMNARAQVVDAWRQVAVKANALQGQFDVEYDLTTNTSPAESSFLGFSGGRTRHQLILRTDLPIVRRAERNEYRAALIGYQRQRRILMAFEDNILTDTRQDLRTLRQTAESFKLSQRAVELAFAQVDNARATLLAPPDPKVSDSAGGPAALTEQLLNAQDGLVQAQNGLYTAWVNYTTTRMELYLDLDLLPLDTRGVWLDDLSAHPGTDRNPSRAGDPAPIGGR